MADTTLTDIRIDGGRLLDDLRALAGHGRMGAGVRRLSYTPDDLAARDWLRGRMEAAGLDVAVDGIGNVYGRTPGVAKAVLIGSHTDTVPTGGWLDGAMGVIYGLEVARAAREAGLNDVGVDVISFADEEGTFIGTTGSKSFCGEVTDEMIDNARSGDGREMRAALKEAGFEGRPRARLEPDRHVAFLEAHIEQGPKLEAAGRRIGAVMAIVGMRRMRVTFGGQNDHAGTTPMRLRRDAGGALFRFVHEASRQFRKIAAEDTVWNVGHLRLEPGAPNVVQSEAEVVVEYRDRSEDLLDRMEGVMESVAKDAAEAANAGVTSERIMRMIPAEMDAGLVDMVENAARDLDAPAMRMISGAGHDAMVLARYLPAAMLFVPSIGGRSHDTSEDTGEDDIVLGCQVLARVIAGIGARKGAL